MLQVFQAYLFENGCINKDALMHATESHQRAKALSTCDTDIVLWCREAMCTCYALVLNLPSVVMFYSDLFVAAKQNSPFCMSLSVRCLQQ